MLAIAACVAFGVTLANLYASTDALAATEEQFDDVERDFANTKFDLTEVTVERDQLKDAADDVAEREAAVEVTEAELEAREAAVKAAEDYQQATTLKDGYTYTVGLTMEPGVYRTDSTNSSCYWAIYRSGSNYSDIVDNDLGSMGAVSVTVGDGQDFTSNRCGDWTKVG